jgi:hypothetical protein
MPSVTPSFIARSSESSLQSLKFGTPSICWAKAGPAARKNTAASSDQNARMKDPPDFFVSAEWL